MEITPDEIMVVCMARQVKDGDIVVQGLATPLVAAAYLLARQTHAPNLYFASAIGQGMCRNPAPIGLANIESLWLDRAITSATFVQVASEILPTLRPIEFFRPAQVDPSGNTNNIAFGASYQKPRLRLPGTGGIPDVTTFISDIYYYVPRHSRITFAARLDFVSGLGYNEARRRGDGPRYLITDLGQFDFQQGRLRLTSYHPGVTIGQIQARTGFELQIAPDIHETPLPTPEDLRLVREVIDPLGVRRLEMLSGAPRHQLLHEILAYEAQQERLASPSG